MVHAIGGKEPEEAAYAGQCNSAGKPVDNFVDNDCIFYPAI